MGATVSLCNFNKPDLLLTGLVHPREHGEAPLDVTAYHPDQRTWGPDRETDWPSMPDQLLFRFECRGYPVPTYPVPNMCHQGRIVLDAFNNPVKDYSNIPKTLSSLAEGYLMEQLIRSDTRINHVDLLARMPFNCNSLSLSAVAMRISRFRHKHYLPPWKAREGSNYLKSYVQSLLSEEGFRKNSVEELCLEKSGTGAKTTQAKRLFARDTEPKEEEEQQMIHTAKRTKTQMSG